MTCNSEWVIYLCSCKKCGGQYVGKSKTPFKIRHSNHKREIKNKIGGLGHHYGGSGGCGYESISIVIIEEIEEKHSSSLQRENHTGSISLGSLLKMEKIVIVTEKKCERGVAQSVCEKHSPLFI